ncbi:universal stress protein [Limnovirga soli]|jgi:nucleotide-binding universal stress UspA family protein|uniref:UspA domain-containing protein n=1 Tax=Limnovirga soli TaxID=2656915 RepID=A0A8J8F9Y7_9BACT|nr:universal stress protein [Limnovirga soli]NNV54133.1 hypothetical protein [Limnovirga soli]
MKTIIVPTDFSDTSKNAARFAAGIASQAGDVEIILYHAFEEKYEDRITTMETALNEIKDELISKAAYLNVSVLAVAEDSFTEGLERVIRHREADLVVMGTTGATPLQQLFVGSNTLTMIDKNICPIMVIPPDAAYSNIKKVAITCDYKDVYKTIPVKPLHKILDLFNPFVHVINIDTEHYVELTEEYKAEKEKLEEILKDYKHDFSFIRLYDFIEAIDSFTEDYNIDLIITFPKKNSFFGGLFKESTTKKLKYHTDIPMITIHE